MKKHLLLVLFFSQMLSCYSQTIQQVDSVATKMCESLSNLKEINEETQVSMIFQKHLPGFYKKLKVTTNVKADSIRDLLYYRLQKQCNEFQVILSHIIENKSDWKVETKKPKCEISKTKCNLFFKGGTFFYKENDGTIVTVLLTENSWKETFEDGTFSLLSFHRIENCEFELEFIESNNETRRNFSVRGDKYHYGISSEKNGIYNFWVIGNDNSIYSSLFYIK